MQDLVALAMPGGPEFVTALRRIWDDGDAVLPVDLRLPPTALNSLLDDMAPAAVVDQQGRHGRAGARPVEPGDALVMATSGTTGRPKGVVLTQHAVEASAMATTKFLGVDPSRHKWLACLPLAHVGGFTVITKALHSGADLEVHNGFDLDAVTDAARRGVTHISLVPTAYARIDPTMFDHIVVGGAAPPRNLAPNASITYGMTETGSGCVYDRIALPGVELRQVDEEIQVRGPMLLRCYRDGSDPKTGDGWYPTGDIGRIDPDTGLLHIDGRKGDLIISGGENVWPGPVERVLAEHPGVEAVAVVGRRDDEWGHIVTAIVAPVDRARPPTLDDLRAKAKEGLAPFMAPRRLELVDEVPRTALGKIRRDPVVNVDVAETIRRGYLAMWDRQIGYIEGARSFRNDGLAIFLSGLADPALDTVLVESEPTDPGAALDAAMALCEISRTSFVMEVPDGRYPELEDALNARRASVAMTKPAYARRLGTVEEPELAGLTIDVVSDPDALHHAWVLDVAAFGFKAETAARYLPPAALTTAGRSLLYGRLGEEVVTMASVHIDHGALGIFGVATSPAHRRRGYGAAITQAALVHGAAHGAAVAWLHSTPIAIDLYTELGFAPVVDWHVWTT